MPVHGETPFRPDGTVAYREPATLPPRPPGDDAATWERPSVNVSAAQAAVTGYEVLHELGRGGMGVVYKARQVALNRLVALKMILGGGHASGADLARFRTEAESIARLQHPNVVNIYEVGEHAGVPFFSLEFCPAGSLAATLDGTPWEPARAAVMVTTLARAIQAAHDLHIVHRDLKPANILLAADGTPKITDFDLAKRLDGSGGLTATGLILGTPSYMAPEQANGSKDTNAAADIYALGAILYELLTGRPPFKAPTDLDTVLQVVSDDPVAPKRLQSNVPADLEAVCLKCLEKRPSDRFRSAAALADDLEAWGQGRPVSARRLGVAGRTIRWMRGHILLVAFATVYSLLFLSVITWEVQQFGPTSSAVLVMLAVFILTAPFGMVLMANLDRQRKEVIRAAGRANAPRNSLAHFGPIRVGSKARAVDDTRRIRGLGGLRHCRPHCSVDRQRDGAEWPSRFLARNAVLGSRQRSRGGVCRWLVAVVRAVLKLAGSRERLRNSYESNCLAQKVIDCLGHTDATLVGVSGVASCGVNPDGTWYEK